MNRDHRPYFVKKAYLKFEKFYTNRFLRPHFESLGRYFTFMRPWNVEIFGSPIEIGDYATVIASSDSKIRLSIWPHHKGEGIIKIGNFCMICPGVRIGSAAGIFIDDSCMIASNVYITDSDWHDIYNRIAPGKTDPVNIEKNVWIGDSTIICKGVTIGENSIIGAGAVVVNPIPANVIAAGNPAKVVKHLDSEEKFTTRARWFSEPEKLFKESNLWEKAMLEKNTFFNWLRYLFFPQKGD
ncbi:MAG: acyltransferase [Thermodesulfobacteriota bacterium]|nr:acyltransferase [Thermodesulfobacteriota bacterium]